MCFSKFSNISKISLYFLKPFYFDIIFNVQKCCKKSTRKFQKQVHQMITSDPVGSIIPSIPLSPSAIVPPYP